jgi:hypothetical protein
MIGALAPSSMPSMFVEKALSNLLADRDIKRSHHAELKVACEKALADLKAQTEKVDKKGSSLPVPAQVNGNGNGGPLASPVLAEERSKSPSQANSSILPDVSPDKSFNAEAMFRSVD